MQAIQENMLRVPLALPIRLYREGTFILLWRHDTFQKH